jgi:hypothetical protein
MKLTNKLIERCIKALYDLDHGSVLNLAMWNNVLRYLLWLGVDQDDINRYTADLNLRIRQANPGIESKVEAQSLDDQIEIIRTLVKIQRVEVSPIIQRLCKDIEKLASISEEWPTTAQSICDRLRSEELPTPKVVDDNPEIVVKAFYDQQYPKVLRHFKKRLNRSVGLQVIDAQLAIDRLKMVSPEWFYEHRTRSNNELRDILLKQS